MYTYVSDQSSPSLCSIALALPLTNGSTIKSGMYRSIDLPCTGGLAREDFLPSKESKGLGQALEGIFSIEYLLSIFKHCFF